MLACRTDWCLSFLYIFHLSTWDILGIEILKINTEFKIACLNQSTCQLLVLIEAIFENF